MGRLAVTARGMALLLLILGAIGVAAGVLLLFGLGWAVLTAGAMTMGFALLVVDVDSGRG